MVILVGLAGGYVGYTKAGVRPAGATTLPLDGEVAPCA